MRFFHHLFKASWAHIASHLLYFTGISILIPLISASIDARLWPWHTSIWTFTFSITLMALGVGVLFWLERSLGKVMRAVGWMMFIPGVVAVIFSFFTSDFFFHTARDSITGFAVVEPGVEWFVHHSVPHTVNIGALYILIGLALVKIGERTSRLAEFL